MDGPAGLTGPVRAALEEAIAKLRFGVVQLTVHEGRVVQLEVTEKKRF
ncbi:MAG: YezD family protein [Sphingomonadales bacterium]|nr:YezD family protein [Sphingomonadales bacterium]